MICFNTRTSKKKARYDSVCSRLAAEAEAGSSGRIRLEKPMAIYSKKFAESYHSDERIFYNNKRATLYKTEMCRSFSETGTCRYGDSCQFCHSESELRTVERHPKYKTEICRTFWLEGSCPYGKRCCFAHLDNADLVEKAKRLGAMQKPCAAKDSENAQLSAFRFTIDDGVPGCSDEDTVCMQDVGSKPLPVGACDIYACTDEVPRQAGTKYTADDIIKAICSNSQTGRNPMSLAGAAPDLFSSSTKFGKTSLNRNEAFTFSRYYSGSFTPSAAADSAAHAGHQSTWNFNKIGIWKREPLNFIPEDAHRRK